MEKYLINHNQVSGEVFDNEAVVVNFMTGKYFGMSGSGPDIWKLFESPVSVNDVIAILKGNYSGITEAQIQEVRNFFQALLNEGLDWYPVVCCWVWIRYPNHCCHCLHV